MPERLNLQTPANPEAIGEIRRELTAFATTLGAGEAARDAVRLAVSEAVTNVVVHAYSDGRSGDVTVEAWREGASHLVVLVSDEGCGMTRNAGTRGTGFGLVLMTQLASGFVISSRDGKPGTVVSLRFALA